MENKSIKHFIVVVFFVFLVSCLFISVCYLVYQKREKAIGNKQYLSVRFETSDVIGITNQLPVSDALGKVFSDVSDVDESEGYVRFSIQNTGNRKVRYNIVLSKQSVDGDEIKGEYIKCYLTDENDTPFEGFDQKSVPTYNKFSDVKSRFGSKLIYSGSIEAKAVQQLRLRLWLSDSYVLSKELEAFRVDVDVEEK